MTSAQAKKRAMALAAEGMRYQDIGQKLAAEGYVSKRTGKGLTQSGVHALLNKPMRKSKGAKRQAPSAKRRPHKSDLATTLSFIFSSSASPEDKLALAEMILAQE